MILELGLHNLPMILELGLHNLPMLLELGLHNLPMILELGLNNLPMILELGLHNLPMILELGLHNLPMILERGLHNLPMILDHLSRRGELPRPIFQLLGQALLPLIQHGVDREEVLLQAVDQGRGELLVHRLLLRYYYQPFHGKQIF